MGARSLALRRSSRERGVLPSALAEGKACERLGLPPAPTDVFSSPSHFGGAPRVGFDLG